MPYGSLLADVVQSSVANTPPQFNDTNGVQTGTLCRAWVNFNGTGTVAIRASFNVSSITDNGGTGDYTINFTTAMPDVNYCIPLGVGSLGTGSATRTLAVNSVLTSSVRVVCILTTSSPSDLDSLNVAIFR